MREFLDRVFTARAWFIGSAASSLVMFAITRDIIPIFIGFGVSTLVFFVGKQILETAKKKDSKDA